MLLVFFLCQLILELPDGLKSLSDFYLMSSVHAVLLGLQKELEMLLDKLDYLNNLSLVYFQRPLQSLQFLKVLGLFD